MNLLCPNCQKQLSVPEHNAGQLMKCPHCDKPFSVPALPGTTDPVADSSPPSARALQSSPGAPHAAASSSPPAQADVFALSLQPTSTPALPPRPAEAAAVRSAPLLPRTDRELSSSGPPTGYEPAWTIWLSPRVIRWIAPIALLLVLILMFFPWTGVLPGGYAVYTQNALQMIWGGYSIDPTGEKVIGMEKAINEIIRANWLMIFYFLLILAALLLAATSLLARITYPLPRALQRIWPWRTVLIVVATLLAFFILLSVLASGSGLENAVIAVVKKNSQKEPGPPNSLEEQIELGLQLSRLGLTRTFWLHGAVLLHVLALVGAGLELWLERRGARPLPRWEVYW